MLERPLVPLDSSAVSEQVLPYVELIAGKLQEPITLVSVLAEEDDALRRVPSTAAAMAPVMDERRRHAERYLEGVRSRLAARGVKAGVLVKSGRVAESILEAAAAERAGLIAMATHGRVGPERWFLGSVTDRVVRTASVPVLLVRPRQGAGEAPASIRQIVLPLDGSPRSEAAIPYASFLAKTFAAPVTVLRSLELAWLATGGDAYGAMGMYDPTLLTTLEEDARHYLDEKAAELKNSGVEAQTSFTFGPPAAAIEEEAGRSEGALVVMGTHGRSGLERTLLGSVADRVIRSSVAPVLVIRGEDNKS